MNNKLVLSIAMTSVITLNSGMAFADTSPEAPVEAQSKSKHGGKCAAVNVAQKSALKNKN